MPSTVTLDEWERLLDQFIQRDIWNQNLGVTSFFLSLTDAKDEGNWTDYYTGQPIQCEGAFIPGEPNGEQRQNCAFPQSMGTGWFDYYCESYFGCLCDNRPNFYVRLRGLNCTSSAIDTLFIPKNSAKDITKFMFMGKHGTRVEQDEKGWKISVHGTNLTGITEATGVSFALGKNEWTMEGDPGCNDGKSFTLPLKLTGCEDGKFTCDDGQCVDMEERCDQLPQCKDESDERECKILVLKKGYNKNVPPIISLGGKKGRVNVSISIDLLKLVDIDEADYTIEIQFEITLAWKENRATYYNLKVDEILNALTQTDIAELWLP